MTSAEIERYLLKSIERTRDSILTKIVEKTTRDAQKNFNAFEVQASTDNPKVSVHHGSYQKSLDEISCEVYCYGDQVAFIEFGVGYNNSLIKANGSVGVGSWGGKSGNQGAFGFAEGGLDETSIGGTRSQLGIHELGHYGKGLGSDDVWIRPSMFGIPNEYAGESHVHKKDGSVRTDVVWTVGHNPARALWRAYIGAYRSVINEINRKPREPKESKYTQLSLFD